MKPTGLLDVRTPKRTSFTRIFIGILLVSSLLAYSYSAFETLTGKHHHHRHGRHAERRRLQTLCKSIHTPAGPPPGHNPHSRVRSGSERFVPGTPPTLLRNARIWTGGKEGSEVIHGDVLMHRGVIVHVGNASRRVLDDVQRHGPRRIEVVDVAGKWVTPGLVDLHSHIGVSSAPDLSGAHDGNSHKAPILPWLRSVDGLNTHDDSYALSISGGVTTAQILPGSANNIGGQSFLIKLRSTNEKSTTSLLLEPPHSLLSPELRNATGTDSLGYIPWRHMKHACGENPSRTYSQTRMDSAWHFRRAYNEAKKIKVAQDAFCAKVDAGEDMSGETFPEDLEWEALVDVLRGKVKLSVHCYEAVDLDAIVRLSNEFQFPVASFHHAGETYLVPELLKKTWGGAPAIALFASNARKKREAYRASEFAPRVLAEHGIPVVMKSDHPVLNSRYLLYEAQQAHYYGLPASLALSSITTVPANAAGVGMRIGQVKAGYDADIVVWDSHPLNLGATPVQVYIDGIQQLTSPHTLTKPAPLQELQQPPNWDKEAQAAVDWQGLPPLEGRKVSLGRPRVDEDLDVGTLQDGIEVRFVNVSAVYAMNEDEDSVEALFESDMDGLPTEHGENVLAEVIVRGGEIACVSSASMPCPKSHQLRWGEVKEMVIDLQGGTLAPGLTTFGSPLGLVEIRLEASTADGNVVDPLTNPEKVSSLVAADDDVGIVRAVDGLQFGGRNTLLAYRNGVTKAVTPPSNGGSGFLLGVSTAFDLGAEHVLEEGAVIEEEVAVHVAVDTGLKAGVSTEIAALRRMLFKTGESVDEDVKGPWARVREGIIPLVVHVESADVMATLISLKKEYEARTKQTLSLTFAGATEAHLLANEIARADVSVILTSPRPFPRLWSQRRILPGPPLTQQSGVTMLLEAGVNVAIGVVDEYNARNTRFDLGWIALESNTTLTRAQTLGLATVNLNKALGIRKSRWGLLPDLVAYRGGNVLEMNSKAVGVVSPRKRAVIMF